MGYVDAHLVLDFSKYTNLALKARIHGLENAKILGAVFCFVFVCFEIFVVFYWLSQ
jgi:hypothetical protein